MQYFIVSGIAFITDYFSKKEVNRRLPLYEKKQVKKLPLYFCHIKNRGFAYHILSGKRQTILLSSGAVLAGCASILAYLLPKKGRQLEKIGLSLILGGGLGNFWERLKDHRVTDFLYLPLGKKAPIFNLADFWIWIGTVCYICSSIFVKYE